MYSPKIRDDLIPLLYKIKEWRRKPMTELVDEILRAEVLKRHAEVIIEEQAFYFYPEEELK